MKVEACKIALMYIHVCGRVMTHPSLCDPPLAHAVTLPPSAGLCVRLAPAVLIPACGARCPAHPRLQQQEAGDKAVAPHDLCLALPPAQVVRGESPAGHCSLLPGIGNTPGTHWYLHMRYAMKDIVYRIQKGHLAIVRTW